MTNRANQNWPDGTAIELESSQTGNVVYRAERLLQAISELQAAWTADNNARPGCSEPDAMRARNALASAVGLIDSRATSFELELTELCKIRNRK